jgi:hypothetical protein
MLLLMNLKGDGLTSALPWPVFVVGASVVGSTFAVVAVESTAQRWRYHFRWDVLQPQPTSASY